MSLSPSTLTTPNGRSLKIGKGDFLGGKYSVDDVIAFGGIS
jgi:hypothetical protein